MSINNSLNAKQKALDLLYGQVEALEIRSYELSKKLRLVNSFPNEIFNTSEDQIIQRLDTVTQRQVDELDGSVVLMHELIACRASLRESHDMIRWQKRRLAQEEHSNEE